MSLREYIVSLSGASGMPYAKKVMFGIMDTGNKVSCVVSESARRVLAVEAGITLSGKLEEDTTTITAWSGISNSTDRFEMFAEKDVASRIASGSAKFVGMVVVPCSGSMLSRIANGVSLGLIERTAEVCLKERRPLILVLRESPLSLTYIKNMLSAAQAGATIMPASPGFYFKPKTVDDLVNMISSRVLDHLGITTSTTKRWSGPN